MHKAIIEIKKPCLVNLDIMVSDEKGRFCTVCQTSVVDFTNKTPDEIAQYFQLHKNENPCGTFNSWEVKTDNKLDHFISYLQNRKLKFAAVFIMGLVVLAGCRTKKRGRTSGAMVKFSDEKTNTIENIK